MINYKDEKWLITVDLDGTFLNPSNGDHFPNSDFNSKNKEVIQKLLKLGHRVAIVTGRPWKDTEKVYKSMGIETIISNYNGAYIHFPGNDDFIPLTFSINKDLLYSVLNEPIIKDCMTSAIAESLNTTYSTDQTTDLADKITSNREGLNVVKWDISKKLPETPLSSLVGIDLSKIDDPHSILQTLNRKYGNAMFFRFWDYRHDENPWLMLEINQKTSNKGTAMKQIAEYYNIPLTRTIAFGDGMNDREMLMSAAVGVAMKNAKGTVKTYANDTTDFTNGEAGVGLYLEKFFDL